MNDSNGFNEYRRLYEERNRLNETRHTEVMTELRSLSKRLGNAESKIKLFSAGYGALGAGVTLAVTFLIALMGGGCNAW